MIGVLGISHKSAPLEIRELFSIPKEEITEFGELILKNTPITEIVILSTCNRTEVYYYHRKSCIKKTTKQLTNLIHQFKAVTTDYSGNFYTHSNISAVKHLFSVTSGLESMVFGEDQIVKQVKEAYLHCTNQTLTDAVLMRLFQKSFETAKRVRTETSVQQGATSVPYVAVEQCSRLVSDIRNKKVLMIGTGETGQLVIQKMKKLGVKSFQFANRTYEKAVQLAEENNGKAIYIDDIKNHLAECDIVITATAAGSLLINNANVQEAMVKREFKQQIYIDLSVPRNIEPSVESCDNANLLSVDSLKSFVEETAEKRKLSKDDAEAIIEQMTGEYFSWYDNRSLRPVIKAITDNMQKIHETEIEKYRQSYSSDVFNAVDEFAGRLTQKYIRTLIKNLRELNENGEVAHSLNAINNLFEFEIDNKK